MTTEFQTRSELTGINLYDSFNSALNAAEKDKTIWKISYTTPDTKERIRLIKTEHGWILETVFGVR